MKLGAPAVFQPIGQLPWPSLIVKGTYYQRGLYGSSPDELTGDVGPDSQVSGNATRLIET